MNEVAIEQARYRNPGGLVTFDSDCAAMADVADQISANADGYAVTPDGEGAVEVLVVVDVLCRIGFVDRDRTRIDDIGLPVADHLDAACAIGIGNHDLASICRIVIAIDGDRRTGGQLDRTLVGHLDCIACPALQLRCADRLRALVFNERLRGERNGQGRQSGPGQQVSIHMKSSVWLQTRRRQRRDALEKSAAPCG